MEIKKQKYRSINPLINPSVKQSIYQSINSSISQFLAETWFALSNGPSFALAGTKFAFTGIHLDSLGSCYPKSSLSNISFVCNQPCDTLSPCFPAVIPCIMAFTILIDLGKTPSAEPSVNCDGILERSVFINHDYANE